MIELLLLIPAAYQMAAMAACIRRIFTFDPPLRNTPPISILKPVYGADPGFYAAIRSHAEQDYPFFEILFAVAGWNDPAVPHIRRLQAEFPDRRIVLIERRTATPNPKVGSLIDLEKEAQYGVLLVNDGDIAVPPGYLSRIAANLDQPGTGLVTCLYRARASSFAGLFEALGVSTDFAPSTLVAPLVGVSEFALGSTMLLRRADLHALGGFEAVADYLADDYRLGFEISRLGKRVRLAQVVVETALGARTFREAWNHQLRWARTVRFSRGGALGYLGMPVTFASAWALAAILSGKWLAGALLIVFRLNVAVVAGLFVLEDRNALWLLSLVPLRDLCAAAVWAAGLFGNTVEWGDRRLRLGADGRIESDMLT